MPAESLILPFAPPDEERKEPFSPNMETIAILALADANRKKTMIIDLLPEKIMFISKLHYPLWIVPWENRSLLIDGMQISSSNIGYLALPEIEPFLESIERGKSDRTQFFNALNQHEQTFTSFSETRNIQCDSVITNRPFLAEIDEYIHETLTEKADTPDKLVLLPPRLDAEAAGGSVSGFLDLHIKLQSDIKGLEYVSQILNQEAKLHQEKINREIELANKAFNRTVEAIRPSVEKNVDRLRKEQDAKTERINKTARTRLNAKLREKERRQRELQKLELKRAECKRRLNARRNRGDKSGTARLELSLRSCENQLANAKARLENSSREVEIVQRQNLEEIGALRFHYQTLIDGETRKIIGIETKRESMMEAKKSEQGRLRLVTARITGQIEQMVEERKGHLTELQELTIAWQPEKATLVAMPFYLIRYFLPKQQRYGVLAPFKAQSPEGIVKKIEKKLLSFSLPARIQLLLEPRSKAIGKMLDSCLEAVQNDKTLGNELAELGKANNLLSQPDLREALTKGIGELEAEGWIKQQEGMKLIRGYVKG